MKRFINSNTKNYHSDTITSFSDENKFLVSGLAKGYNTKEYSWVADFLFKSTGSLSANPHIGKISFVSDADIMYQEYGNVQEIYDSYPFFSYAERSILSDLSPELSTKQYYKVGQRHSEYDTIEYVNISELIQGITLPVSGSVDVVESKHTFYRAPVFVHAGSKLNLNVGAEKSFYDRYLFSRESVIDDSIGEYVLKIAHNDSPRFFIENQAVYDSYTGVDEVIVDYKVNVSNPKYGHFEEGVTEIVYYHNETNAYRPGIFSPYYGLVKVYRTDDVSSVYNWIEDDIDEILYFPQIIANGKLEPAKVVAERSVKTDGPIDIPPPQAALSFYSINNLNDPKDQSRIVYNASKSMLSFQDGFELTAFYKVEKKDPNTLDILYSGIDVDTERNRRYSAVVMTEPYFVTTPLTNGKLVDYYFVFEDGTPVSNWTNEYKPIFLKIRSSLDVLTELDKELVKVDRNTDVINTLTVNNIVDNRLILNNSTEYYDDFRGASDEFFYKRQDDCLDDLIGGVVGSYDIGDASIGTHRRFYINSFGDDQRKYSDFQMKVCGAGIEYKGDNIALKLYCTNYIAVDAPIPGDVTESPRFGPVVEFINNSNVDSYEKNELIKPMIKIPGMNGYVKIMRKDQSFKTARSPDGRYESVFQVEFPYCPGSFKVREEMNFIYDEDTNPEPFYTGFVLKKKSYINAGSREVDGNIAGDPGKVYDIRNDRFAPYGDDAFTNSIVLSGYTENDGESLANSGKIKTDSISNGGNFREAKSGEKSLVKYPRDLVLRNINDSKATLFMLEKPRYSNFRRYGTFSLGIEDEANEDPNYSADIKLVTYSDNRRWKFNDDKFASYVGRENPCYVFDINVEALLKDYYKFQKDHGSVPDSKRWLYSFFSGFANVIPNKDVSAYEDDGSVGETENSETLSTIGENYDIPVENSESDVLIEIWDQESDVGNGETGNWRPFITVGADEDKIPGIRIVDSIYVMDVDSDPDDNPNEIAPGVWKVFLGHISLDDQDLGSANLFKFPEYINYEAGPGEDILDQESNLILYDSLTKKSFHITFIKVAASNPLGDSGTGREMYEAFVRSDDGIFDVLDLEGDIALDGSKSRYEIRRPFKTISGDIRFSTPSVKAKNGIDLGFLGRFIDLKDTSASPSDFERYVLDDKIRFRVRVAKGKKYPVSYIDEDSSKMPYVGSGIDLGKPDYTINVDGVNFPWKNLAGDQRDIDFDWTKIEVLETARKFGLNYFKCASK